MPERTRRSSPRVNDSLKRVILKADTLRLGRLEQRLARGVGAQRSDLRVGEQTLGIGLGIHHQAGKLGKARAGQCDRQLLLGHPVHRGGHSLHLLTPEELHLVDQEHHAGLVLSRRLAELYEQVGQVTLEVARRATHRGRVERELDAALDARADLEAAKETGKGFQPVAERTATVEAQQRLIGGVGELGTEVCVRADLDGVGRGPSRGVCDALELQQQDRLADAA